MRAAAKRVPAGCVTRTEDTSFKGEHDTRKKGANEPPLLLSSNRAIAEKGNKNSRSEVRLALHTLLRWCTHSDVAYGQAKPFSGTFMQGAMIVCSEAHEMGGKEYRHKLCCLDSVDKGPKGECAVRKAMATRKNMHGSARRFWEILKFSFSSSGSTTHSLTSGLRGG